MGAGSVGRAWPDVVDRNAVGEDRPVLHVKPRGERWRCDVGTAGERAIRIHHVSCRARASTYWNRRACRRAMRRACASIPSDLIKSYRVSTYSSAGNAGGARRSAAREGRRTARRAHRCAGREPHRFARPERGCQWLPAMKTRRARQLLYPQPPRLARLQSPLRSGVSQSISQVNLAENSGQTNVNVVASGPLTYHATLLEKPDRLVLDFTALT